MINIFKKKNKLQSCFCKSRFTCKCPQGIQQFVIDNKTFNELHFNEIISSGRHGIIWDGKLGDKTCVIKMVKLNNYKSFKNDVIPFLHKEFNNKTEMNINEWIYEIQQQSYLHELKIAPKIYEFWIYDKFKNINYAFMIMKKMDCSVKQIISERDLDKSENSLIQKLIDRMNKHGIIHGDLKPANIGVKLNAENKIKKCLILDCAKIKHKASMSEKKFNDLVKKDWERYYHHFSSNSLFKN